MAIYEVINFFLSIAIHKIKENINNEFKQINMKKINFSSFASFAKKLTFILFFIQHR